MRDGGHLLAFSRFVGALHEAAAGADAGADGEGLLPWAAGRLAADIGFDAAWCGWADVVPDEVEIVGTAVVNLPGDYVAHWNAIRAEDLLARDVKATGRRHSSYDRHGARQTEGLAALADRYGLTQLSVVTRAVDPLRPQLFLSAYRGGATARALKAADLAYIGCALDHLQAALDRGGAEAGGALRLLVDARGRPVAGSAAALALWADWQAAGAPGRFADHAAARGLGAVASPRPMPGGQVLTVLRLCPTRLEDRLSGRERDIARLISEGRTHKEIARALHLSPATVRNHTARIYGKAGVGSRAALTRALCGGG